MLLLKLYEDSAEAEEYLHVIQKESNRLIRLVQRVLDFSRIEKGKRETILKEVRGDDYYSTLRTVDNFITRLRQKLEKDSANPQYILTARCIRYKFNFPIDEGPS